MAQGFKGEGDGEGDVDPRDPRDEDTLDEASRRWPASMPTASVAAVVLTIDEAVTLKRTAAAAWLTAHGDAVPSLPPRLPLRPTRMELAVIIALAETYGAALHTDARYVVVLDFIADHAAVVCCRCMARAPRPISTSPPLPRKTHCWQRAFDANEGPGVPSGPLVAPIIVPWTEASTRRHRARPSSGTVEMRKAGYTADGLNRLIGRMLTELVETADALDLDDRMRLHQTNAHAFRHTFGTQSVEVPVNVVQKVLDHASLQITTIYAQAEKQRVLTEVAAYYARLASKDESPTRWSAKVAEHNAFCGKVLDQISS